LGEEAVSRRLAAILAADVAGYSRLMEPDEEGTRARLKSLRRDLIDPKIALWKGRIVKTTGDDDTVHDQVRDRLSFSLEDLGERRVKNIARPVRVYRVRPAGMATASAPALPLPENPFIAVLLFQNLSGDSEQEYFADGIVEEIITALSRIRWLFVIARNSSFTYKGQAVDVKRVGRELGVRNVLEGSVRKAGGRVRITAQLVEAESGAHLWADRFDGSLEDVFDLQDKVALSVAGVIEPKLERAETRRSSQRPTADLTAYDLYLRAKEEWYFHQKDRVIRALGLLTTTKASSARLPRYYRGRPGSAATCTSCATRWTTCRAKSTTTACKNCDEFTTGAISPRCGATSPLGSPSGRPNTRSCATGPRTTSRKR
jgi:TolB-like protein